MWSFDIFDTCLVRRQAFPSDLFVELAERLEDTLHPALGADYREVFQEARVESERLALSRCGHEETTLLEIWEELVQLIPALNLESGMSAELALEATALYPVPKALALVQQGRAQHGRVAFISDTYLPQGFIEQQLRRHGLLQVGDGAFLSSEFRVTKRSGKLFPVVLTHLGLPASAITHHGDNPHSDIKMAAAAGLRTCHLPESLLNQHERAVGGRLGHLESGVASRLIGTMRAGRIAGDPPSNAAARSLVATFIGPFLWILAEWILRRAAADGIRRLYFFSRDCHGLHRVARVLSEQLKLGIDCRYLRVSRQTLMLPSITEITPDGIPALRRRWEPGDVGAVLAKLDMDDDEAHAALRGLTGAAGESFRLSTDEHWEQFWTALAREPLQSMLKTRIENSRAAALAYFRQEGLLDSVPSGVVDLGWHQSGQAALTKLLRMGKTDITLPGYYLALNCGRAAFLKGCPAQAVFHRPPGDRRAARMDQELFMRIPVLEHVLNCAPHGSAHHYEVDSSTSFVITVEKTAPAAEREVKTQLYRELEYFTDRYVSPLYLNDHSTKESLAALLNVAIAAPLAEWAELLRAIDFADDQNCRDSSCFVKSRGLTDLVSDALRGRDYRSLPVLATGVWPELSMASNSRPIVTGYRRLEQINRFRRFIAHSLLR